MSSNKYMCLLFFYF